MLCILSGADIGEVAHEDDVPHAGRRFLAGHEPELGLALAALKGTEKYYMTVATRG